MILLNYSIYSLWALEAEVGIYDERGEMLYEV